MKKQNKSDEGKIKNRAGVMAYLSLPNSDKNLTKMAKWDG